jgi:hypothetical protein
MRNMLMQLQGGGVYFLRRAGRRRAVNMTELPLGRYSTISRQCAVASSAVALADQAGRHVGGCPGERDELIRLGA